ncbi:hypothetical protein BACCAP_00231 [Pseudoflavonifractor capillosus ATCC 29799]|uniref:Uncharacterized protein n=1 Tax=Pseudoflavonifractor capillosus ATCC 29799 TaxID=411467 RepID=A6NPW4_9FIRM|nr:hypothetical protein BACCAP_00231 [Pseudoflavonifractor capillosus ATCC 29799]
MVWQGIRGSVTFPICLKARPVLFATKVPKKLMMRATTKGSDALGEH